MVVASILHMPSITQWYALAFACSLYVRIRVVSSALKLLES